jgi:hypothetical protein
MTCIADPIYLVEKRKKNDPIIERGKNMNTFHKIGR